MKATISIRVKERGEPPRNLKVKVERCSLESLEGALAMAVFEHMELCEWWTDTKEMTLECGGWLDTDMPQSTPTEEERAEALEE